MSFTAPEFDHRVTTSSLSLTHESPILSLRLIVFASSSSSSSSAVWFQHDRVSFLLSFLGVFVLRFDSVSTIREEHSFADVDNLEHCVKYLNQSLVTYGFSASLDLFATDPVSIARTCNCIYALIQQRQRDVEFRESTNDQRQR
ncbi:hypothetical protein F2Q68_00019291 [Brassica cretica]|uniref:Uncharacterized protein n=1 Tax=Brassica cretica TaxID=69181 RepID=A0A8S9FVN9_BRACR|nr:hypothetical protein F2Q68_00019291 [Brassica cretica]